MKRAKRPEPFFQTWETKKPEETPPTQNPSRVREFRVEVEGPKPSTTEANYIMLKPLRPLGQSDCPRSLMTLPGTIFDFQLRAERLDPDLDREP